MDNKAVQRTSITNLTEVTKKGITEVTKFFVTSVPPWVVPNGVQEGRSLTLIYLFRFVSFRFMSCSSHLHPTTPDASDVQEELFDKETIGAKKGLGEKVFG